MAAGLSSASLEEWPGRARLGESGRAKRDGSRFASGSGWPPWRLVHEGPSPKLPHLSGDHHEATNPLPSKHRSLSDFAGAIRGWANDHRQCVARRRNSRQGRHGRCDNERRRQVAHGACQQHSAPCDGTSQDPCEAQADGNGVTRKQSRYGVSRGTEALRCRASGTTGKLPGRLYRAFWSRVDHPTGQGRTGVSGFPSTETLGAK